MRSGPQKEDEVYYVLSGRATIRVGDEDRAVQAGSVIFASPGVPHRFHSIREELRILVFFAPAEGTEVSDRSINTLRKVLKPFLIGVLSVVLVQVIGAVIVVMMGLIPANADARPSRLEARLAGLVREAYVTPAAQTTDVTVNPTEANLSEGAKLYKDNCMGCHGGPEGTYRSFSRALYPPAPRFADKGTDLSDAEFYWTTQHGLRWTGMPSFGGEAMDRGGNKLGPMMKPDEMRKINAFVHHIQSLPPAADAEWRKKSPGP